MSFQSISHISHLPILLSIPVLSIYWQYIGHRLTCPHHSTPMQIFIYNACTSRHHQEILVHGEQRWYMQHRTRLHGRSDDNALTIQSLWKQTCIKMQLLAESWWSFTIELLLMVKQHYDERALWLKMTKCFSKSSANLPEGIDYILSGIEWKSIK